MRNTVAMVITVILLASMVLAGGQAKISKNSRDGYLDGVDVSHWQGDVDWNKVYGDGYRFAFVKATEGTGYVDDKFTQNMENANAAGVYVGPYHFAHPDDNAPENEAQHFLDVTSPYLKEGYLVPVLDLEDGSSLGKTALSQWVDDFMNYIYNKTGIRGIVYTNANYASNYLDSSVTQWPLWIAHYGVSSPNTGVWSTWKFWQYRDDGSVNGISGNVDLDYYNGNLQSLLDNFIIKNGTSGNYDATYYDRQAARGYAYRWWNSRNPHYRDYSNSGGDCANFVSQALIAGGLSLWKGYDGQGGGVYSDSNGTMPYCDYLHQNLVDYQNTTYAYVTRDNFTVPDWLRIGDVIIFGNSTGDHWKHAALVVYRNGNDVRVAAHTTDVWNKSITDYFPGEFDLINYYHIHDGKKKNITAFKVTASELHVRAGPGTDYQILGTIDNGEEYVAFDQYIDSSGNKWWKFFYDDRVAWCAAWYTDEVDVEIIWVNVTAWLNVRSGAGTNYNIVGEVYHGMLFVKIDTQYNSNEGRTWYEIWFSSEQEWVAGEYTGQVPEFAAPVYTIMMLLFIFATWIFKENSKMRGKINPP